MPPQTRSPTGLEASPARRVVSSPAEPLTTSTLMSGYFSLKQVIRASRSLSVMEEYRTRSPDSSLSVGSSAAGSCVSEVSSAGVVPLLPPQAARDSAMVSARRVANNLFIILTPFCYYSNTELP